VPAALAALACGALAGAAAGAPAATVAVELAPGTAPAAAGAGAEPAIPPGLVTRLEGRLGRRLPELRSHYRVEADHPADARRLARRLDARAGVEAVVEPVPAPPPAVCPLDAPTDGWPPIEDDAPTPDLSGLQDYREGLAIPAGAAGAGVRIADIEYEWRRTHEELETRGLAAPVLSPLVDRSWMAEDHGTAVLGIISGDADGEGITGLAHGAEVLPRSPFPRQPTAYEPAVAILAAVESLDPGDVLLIEQQDRNGMHLVPLEFRPAVRTAIRTAVSAGIVVVEPAANSGIDLGSLADQAPWLADPAHPENSGALMVGAGGSTATETDLGRSVVSNYGARVDVQGYGEAVLTTGYGQELGPADDPDRRYTACFDGTSSASATVAGAVAVLQGIAIAERGAPLTPAQVRRVLVATGTPQAPPVGGAPIEPIGPRPQVEAAATAAAGIPLPEPPPPPPPAGTPAPAAPEPVAAVPVPPPGPVVAAPRPRPAGVAAAPRARFRPASTSLAARLDRRRGRLTLAVRGLAPRAVVRVGSRVKKPRRGLIVIRHPRPGRLLVRVSAPPRRGVAVRPPADRVRPTAYKVTIPRTGPATVARVRR
jgi:subtilisin family serine protease